MAEILLTTCIPPPHPTTHPERTKDNCCRLVLIHLLATAKEKLAL